MGSMRDQMTPEERSVWYDMLLLAGASRIPGVICTNEATPMKSGRIAEIISSPVTLVERCLEKFSQQGRITFDDLGLLHIENWPKYQYTDYDRQKEWRQKKRGWYGGPPHGAGWRGEDTGTKNEGGKQP